MKKREKQKATNGGNALVKIVAAVLALMFLFSLYQVIKIRSSYREAEDFYQAAVDQYTNALTAAEQSGYGKGADLKGPPLEVDLEKLTDENPDVIGWIHMEDTVVSYPLLQGPNNYYYLDKTYEKKYLASGSIYLDSGNEADLSDAHSVIYGHNMRNHTMFGDLDMFMEPEYLAEHPYVYLLLPEGKWLKYQIYSVYRADVEDGTYLVPLNKKKAFAQFTDLTMDKCIFDEETRKQLQLPEPKAGDRILTLSTCTEDRAETERFVLQAVLVEESDS